MTQDEILLISSLAGSAVLITVADLLFSLVRHRRLARVRVSAARPEATGAGEATATKGERVRRRLTAIEKAGNGANRE